MTGLAGLALAVLLGLALPALGVDFAEAEKLYRSGKYAEAIDAAAKTIEAGDGDEDWWRLKIRGELASGKYSEALKSYESAIERYERSAVLRLLGHEVLQFNDKAEEAAEALALIQIMAERAPWRYSDSASRVAVGRSLLLSGADARQVLELFYDKAKADNPLAVEPLIASAELALEKHDYALAAKEFAEAAKRSADDPDIQLGLARAYPNDEDRANAALTKALEINPRHVESLLFQVDNAIDREGYGPAEEMLKKVLEVNAKHPRAWAYRAVLAHLNGDAKKEEAYRGEALSTWKSNPEVDHLIGSKLSAKYRFAEGAAYQRKALEFVANYKPAKVQLCQDLLRLGKEEEGWTLAAEASKEDPYNVVTFNLVTLHDRLSKFRTIASEHFVVRMDEREAKIYGQRVMRLLERSREKLNSKYGANISTPVTIEIFPQQKDFAIRTFGLPGGAGFLGVCFGPVITVNSPQSRMASPNNWEAIVWHEYCHAVTLHKTRNKMPRWLSEGISVYEERQENGSWGQVMTPQYRELILAGGATPVSQLSGAFLSPPTPMHLQFAYYESSMVVEYIVGRFGMPAMIKVLEDLGRDVPINLALAKHTEAIEKLDESFAAWLKEKAEKLAPGADLKRPEGLALDADSAAMAAWNKDHPDNFWGLLGEGRALLAERKFEEAKKPLTRAAELYPGYSQPGGPFLLLAAAHRELKETKLEREMLERHVALDADAVEARIRLMEIAAGQKDWSALRKVAEEVLAINPLVAPPQRYLAQAAEALGQRLLAIEAVRTLLLLDPLDRAEQHFRLAKMLKDEKQLPAARREVVMALEEAPRYRAAHQLLLEIVGKMEQEAPKPAPATRPTTQPAAQP